MNIISTVKSFADLNLNNGLDYLIDLEIDDTMIPGMKNFGFGPTKFMERRGSVPDLCHGAEKV